MAVDDLWAGDPAFIVSTDCLLIAVWTGRRPTKTVWALVQFCLAGWATEDELIQQLTTLSDARAKQA